VASPAAEAAPPQLPVRVTLLEQNFQALANVNSQNTRVFQTAFMQTDAHIAVHYRVLNDMQKEPHQNPLPLVYRTAEGDIDLGRYHQELADVMGAFEFMTEYSKYADAQLAAELKAEESEHDRETTPGPLKALPDFGGGDDHAQST
jgi:hypothetical protein